MPKPGDNPGTTTHSSNAGTSMHASEKCSPLWEFSTWIAPNTFRRTIYRAMAPAMARAMARGMERYRT